MLVRPYVDTRTLSREMVAVLVDHILIGQGDVEIHWNF